MVNAFNPLSLSGGKGEEAKLNLGFNIAFPCFEVARPQSTSWVWSLVANSWLDKLKQITLAYSFTLDCDQWPLEIYFICHQIAQMSPFS